MQVYHRRYDSRRTLVAVGFSVLVVLIMAIVFYTTGTFQPFWLLFAIMPLLLIWMQRKPPLAFNHQGVKWTYALCEEKSLPRVGFIYWQDIEDLTWVAHSEGGGSVLVVFHRGALQMSFPEPDSALPKKHQGPLMSTLLLLYWLDADSEQVFNDMQASWQRARSLESNI